MHTVSHARKKRTKNTVTDRTKKQFAFDLVCFFLLVFFVFSVCFYLFEFFVVFLSISSNEIQVNSLCYCKNPWARARCVWLLTLKLVDFSLTPIGQTFWSGSVWNATIKTLLNNINSITKNFANDPLAMMCASYVFTVRARETIKQQQKSIETLQRKHTDNNKKFTKRYERKSQSQPLPSAFITQLLKMLNIVHRYRSYCHLLLLLTKCSS